MKYWARLIIGTDKNIEKRNISWNMVGSFLYAFASMVLSIAVIQMVGEDLGGIFTFGFSTFGQHMFMVAYFGIRPFQITDTEGRYSFGEYVRLRYLTCAAAILFGLFYVFINGYSYVKAMTVIWLVIYKVIDGFADAYEAEFQRSGRLYLTGKSNAFRTLLSVSVFLGVLYGTRNLVTASQAAAAAQLLGLLLFDVAVMRALPGIDRTVRGSRVRGLFRDNTLLFFSVVLDFYIFSAAKYAIEGNMTDGDLAVFGAVFMPTSVINLVAGFVVRPYLTKLSVQWENHRPQRFLLIIKRLMLVILGLTVVAVAGAWLLGIQVLSLLYPNISYALAGCRPALIYIILGGALNALMTLFYYGLIIMKRQRVIFAGYLGVGAVAAVISPLFVRAMGLDGGAFSYMILMALLLLCFGAAVMWFYRQEKKRERLYA